jgi:NADH-quinone oxidoreductase subunit M
MGGALVGLVLVAYFLPDALPAAMAASVAALAPRGASSRTRISVALITGVLGIFLTRMWPGVAPMVEAAEDGVTRDPGALLSVVVFLPILGALAVLFAPRQGHATLRRLTLGCMLLTLFASALLLRVPMDRGFHFNHDLEWMPRFGIRYHVALDGISLWLVVLTTFSVPIATFASFGSISERLKDWCFALLLLEGAMVGTFVAMDLFLFYVFWELMLVPMYVMIGVWGGKNRVYAAVKFFLYTMFGSVLMLAAILYLAYTYERLNGSPSFDFFELSRVALPRSIQLWLWAAFTLSFVIKVPMWPVHTWLPDAHTEAPTAGSVILAAVMLKMGTYGYLRFCMGLFPEACAETAANLAGVAVLGGILYGALCAWKQGDVKRLVAYSSVAHLGYVMLGIFAGTPASVSGAVLQMVNHGISTGMLFLLVGVIYDRRHTRALEDFGGLAKVMPLYAVFFVIATMASVGLPGTNGFVGEFMVITGTFASRRLGHFNGVQAAAAAAGVVLGALYMLTAVEKMFFGPVTKRENEGLPDLNRRELVALVPLTLAVFIIGFFPNVFLEPMRGAVERTLGDLDARVQASPPPDYFRGEPKLLSRSSDAPPLPKADP